MGRAGKEHLFHRVTVTNTTQYAKYTFCHTFVHYTHTTQYLQHIIQSQLTLQTKCHRFSSVSTS